MTMGDSEIKNLFVRANAQVHIDEARKQKTHQAMMMEMEKKAASFLLPRPFEM